jgi:DNA-binding MurR/RpiR family transcriptional regulator
MKEKKSSATSAAAPFASAQIFSATPLGVRLKGLMAEGSPGQRKIAEFILRHPIRVSALSIEDLAQASGVSAPTISRFARELDLAGFAEMRGAVADAVQTALNPVAKLKLQLEASGSSRSAETFTAIQSQIGGLDAGVVAAQAAEAAAAIAAARNVHVMGFGLSAHVAALMVLGLQPFCANVAGVVEFGGTEVAAGRLMAIGPGDALVAITFPRYASDVVSLTRYAKDRGARIVALTDSIASPLAPLADILLLAPAEHPTLSSSMAAAVAIAETVVATVMLSDPANAERAARLGEAIGGYLHQP